MVNGRRSEHTDQTDVSDRVKRQKFLKERRFGTTDVWNDRRLRSLETGNIPDDHMLQTTHDDDQFALFRFTSPQHSEATGRAVTALDLSDHRKSRMFQVVIQSGEDSELHRSDLLCHWTWQINQSLAVRVCPYVYAREFVFCRPERRTHDLSVSVSACVCVQVSGLRDWVQGVKEKRESEQSAQCGYVDADRGSNADEDMIAACEAWMGLVEESVSRGAEMTAGVFSVFVSLALVFQC